MANVNFNLKNPQKEKSLIFLMFNYSKHRVKISTGISIPTKHWNYRRQRVRETVDFMDHVTINGRLNKAADLIDELYRREIAKGEIPLPGDLKNMYLDSNENPNLLVKHKDFWGYFEEFIEFKRGQLDDIRDYDKALRKHLKEAEKRFPRSLTFTSIENKSGNFVIVFNKYLMYSATNSAGGQGLSRNTVGKQNKNLKVFLNWCFDNGYVDRFSIKHIVTYTEELDSVYLSEKELKRIEKVKLDDQLDRAVRDLFLLSCETGLRYSDVIRIDSRHIQGKSVVIIPEKTRNQGRTKKLKIPISDRSKGIIDRQEHLIWQNSKGTSNTAFNKRLRDICERAKIDSECHIHRLVAGVEEVQRKRKYELISSHTGRRTFSTLKFRQGIPAQAIMYFTGHKTERSFLRYLRLDDEIVAEQYAQFF